MSFGLCQNCAKTLSNCDVGVYFEREADSPKLLKTLERQNKGRNRWNGCSCLQSTCSPQAYTPLPNATDTQPHAICGAAA